MAEELALAIADAATRLQRRERAVNFRSFCTIRRAAARTYGRKVVVEHPATLHDGRGLGCTTSYHENLNAALNFVHSHGYTTIDVSATDLSKQVYGPESELVFSQRSTHYLFRYVMLTPGRTIHT